MKFKQIIYGLIAIFISSCTGYTKKDGKIYMRSSNEARIGVQYSEVKYADYETFKVINHNLAKDKNNVFYNVFILEHADPNTFKQVKKYYWKDKKNVYLVGNGRNDARIIDADPKTFEVFNNYLWTKDKNHIYHEFNKLNDVDSKSFLPIDENWGKDNQYYYYHNLRVDSLDYKSAKIVNSYFKEEPARPSNYIKDKNHVFFQNRLVKDANPLTFVANGDGNFGHDDKNMFSWETNKGQITQQYKKTYIDKK
jgi:hypothetical protein